MPGNGHTKKGKPASDAGEQKKEKPRNTAEIEQEKPRNTAGNRTYEKGKRRLSDGTMNEKEARG